ncbi:hypothetical protein BDR26DRAFT_902987 [Obelidium mucronatum]|nr:hypothetical protein BDR26DRAFT_902987 [Obelidium mucronatum]
MADHFMATKLDAETAKWTTIYLNKTGSHNQELEYVPEDRLVRLVDETTGSVIALMNVIPLDLLDHSALAEYLQNAPITAKDCSKPFKASGDLEEILIRRKLKEYKAAVVKDPSSVEAKTQLASALLSQLDEKFLNVFSTCAVSHNSPRAAKRHRDQNNYAYAIDACIPFGPFSGGDMIFTQYGKAVKLSPGDFILMDAYHFDHKVGTIEGDRFAVIL